MTKEEIYLDKVAYWFNGQIGSADIMEDVLEAMEQYARSRAIEFAEWVDSNLMFRGSERTWVNAPNDAFPTTAQLYELFSHSIDNKTEKL